jgi:hypothetical protein
MTINRKHTSGWSPLRTLLCLGFAMSAGLVVLAGIASSRAIDPDGSALTEQTDRKIVRRSVDGPTPTPLPCPPCWHQFTVSENFDAVIPPALPPGWLATNAQGPEPLWVVSNSGVPLPPADTPPNSAFVDDPAVLSDKRLDSLGLTFFEGLGVRLTFRHNFNLEASEQNQSVGYDGGVLEVSSDGGNTFQDILAAGGSFVVGGYNRTIASDRSSPIAGRQAWSGNSGGFITTVVNVPASQTANTKVRWRMASDSTGSGEGWRVDSVNITWCHGDGPPCGTPTPIASRPTPTARPRSSPAPRPTP